MNQRLIETASFINRHIPDLKNNIIREADLALEGMLILPGSGGSPVFVGNPPMWKENPTPQKDREDGTLEDACRGIYADGRRKVCQ